MPTGHFIVIEGLDGSGKGTQIDLLRQKLPQGTVFTREPGGSAFGEEIRKVILSPLAGTANSLAMIELFGAARFDHIRHVIWPALHEGKVVISDRFDASTYAYQLVAQHGGKTAQEFFRLQRAVIESHEAFEGHGWLTLVLDVSAEVAKARAHTREGQEATHFDKRDLDFHERVRMGYRQYAETYSGVCIIDASRDAKSVHRDVLEHISQYVAR